MKSNREEQEKHTRPLDSFNISDLPAYGYTYKERPKPFAEDFQFSMTSEPSYATPMEESMLLLNSYPEQTEIDTNQKKPHLEIFRSSFNRAPEYMEYPRYTAPLDAYKSAPAQYQTALDPYSQQPAYKHPGYKQLDQYRQFAAYKTPEDAVVRPEYKEYEFEYAPNEEQAVYVNANQYPYIKRRKERRDFLDSLEKKKDVSYQHESRHKHAMKRPRAPSGRFLTKEEAILQGKE